MLSYLVPRASRPSDGRDVEEVVCVSRPSPSISGAARSIKCHIVVANRAIFSLP